MTVEQLITASAQVMGKMRPGQQLNQSQKDVGLQVLEDLRDGLNIEKQSIFQEVRTTHPLVINQKTYVLGDSQEWNAPRPIRILRAGMIKTNVADPKPETPIRIGNYDNYADIRLKDRKRELVTFVWPQFAETTVSLTFWPVPTIAHQVALYTEQPLTAFTSLAQVIGYPPGYARMWRYNLAVELAPSLGFGDVPRRVQLTAWETLESVKRLNRKRLESKVPTELMQPLSWDFETNNYRDHYNI